MAVSSTLYHWVVHAITLISLTFVVNRALLLWRIFAKIKDYPGRLSTWISPLGPLPTVLGTTFPRPGMAGYKAAKFSIHKKLGATSFVSVWLSTAQQIFWLADSEAIKIVAADRHTFQKGTAEYEMVNIYGGNIVSLEGSDWKRHRSVAMSAFNEANVVMVWTESLRVASEWIAELDAKGPQITLNMLPPLMKVTLHIIVAAAFGKRLSWMGESTAEPPPGCKLNFQPAVFESVDNIIFRSLTPGWFYKLSSLIKVPYLSSRALLTQVAFNDLRIHMLDLIASARAEIMSGEPSEGFGAPLLRNLVEANMNQDGGLKMLTEEELLSDIFVFLIAGHETSANTLCFAFAFLALYPGCQQKVYEEVTRVWPVDGPLEPLTKNHKEYLDKLEYTEACIRETLRLLPMAPCLAKDVHKDTVLPGTYFTPGSNESATVETGKFSMVVPAGSIIAMDVWSLHMNPLYWGEDVEEFKPENFIDTESYQWPRNAFLPFSGGARSCIGQRFALVEMVGILASVTRRYRIEVPDDLVKEPFGKQKEELLKWMSGVTLTPLNNRVKLCRRASE